MTDAADRIRVFLMDDHEVVREGVRQLLESSGEIEVVGEAATCADALTRIPATRPAVAILDVQLPDGSGVEVCREIRNDHPNIACLMLTSFSDEEALFQSIMAGAAGYVLKQIRGNDLVATVKRVAAGESLIDPAVTGRLLERLRNPQPEEDPRLASLTKLERVILPRREDGEELRVEPAREARHGASHRGGGVRGAARRAPPAPDDELRSRAWRRTDRRRDSVVPVAPQAMGEVTHDRDRQPRHFLEQRLEALRSDDEELHRRRRRDGRRPRALVDEADLTDDLARTDPVELTAVGDDGGLTADDDERLVGGDPGGGSALAARLADRAARRDRCGHRQ